MTSFCMFIPSCKRLPVVLVRVFIRLPFLGLLILKIIKLEISSKIYFALLISHAHKLEAKQKIALPPFYATKQTH